jgi:putative hydrolase
VHSNQDPAEVLREIAFLLEAQGAPTYKVRAFRQAASTVEAIERAELLALARANQLQRLAGIGKTTARVISESLSGIAPTYLQDLQSQEPVPSAHGAAGQLLAALRGDCHSHSEWSDGGSPIDEMARTAMRLGHEYLALTDHSPRLTVAHGLQPEDLRRQQEVVAALSEELAPFRLLTGIEVDILEDGSLDQDDHLLAELDVVVASVHSKLRMDRVSMTRRMLAAIENPLVDILGHCTGRILTDRGRPQSEFDHERVFRACSEFDTAVEINSRPDRRDPPHELLELAVAQGCRFAVDSDAHVPGQLTWLAFGCAQAVEAGVRSESVVNTMNLADFMAWTASHQ